MNQLLPPHLDDLGRWQCPDPDCDCVRMLRRTGRFRLVLTAWLEEQITAMVELAPERLQQLASPEAIRQERLRLFREAAFSLHVEEHFSRSKRDRDRIIYSMLRCRNRPRLDELALAIREGELDFAAARFDFQRAQKVLRADGLALSPQMLAIQSSSAGWSRPVRGI